MKRFRMEGHRPPLVVVNTDLAPAQGENLYVGIPESVEYRRMDRTPGEVNSLGLGRLVLALDSSSQELVGLQAHVKTSRWKTGEAEPPPEPDAEGALFIKHDFGEEDFAFVSISPVYLFHDDSRSLRIRLAEGAALAFRAADCLMAGIDRSGHLTDIWMLDLDIQV